MTLPRPTSHLATAATWLNDPNGLVLVDGVWHAYYQTNPYGVDWGSMSWGHATSPDLATWTEQPVAIPNLGDGEEIYSGSVVVDHRGRAGFGAGALVAVYTSNYVAPHPRAGTSAQSLAASVDGGYTWTRNAGNPVLDRGSKDFRDPKVFPYGDGWVMVAVEAEEKAVVIYRSGDLRSWTSLSRFEHPMPWGGIWECPDLVRPETAGESGWVLLLSLSDGLPGGGSGTLAIVGDFDGTSFHASAPPATTPSDAPWLDRGRDHYATVSFGEVAGRVVVLGWMNNWAYASHIPLTGGRSALTLPRELGLARQDGRLRVTVRPARELAARLDDPPPGLRVLRLDPRDTHAVDLPSARLVVADGVVRLERTGEWHPAFPGTTEAPLPATAGELLVVVDTCSVEVFSDDGLVALTNLVFAAEPPTPAA